MRVLFGVSGWQSHYFTVAPLAWAFRVAGHEVLVTTQPSLTEVVRRSGIATAPAGPDVDLVAIRRQSLAFQAAEAHEGELGSGPAPEILELWRAATQSNLDGVVALARQWRPDLVVADPMCPAGLVAAQLLGVPGIRYQLAPDPIVGSAAGEAILPHLPGFYEPYERFGLHPEGDPALRTVDPCPPSLLPPPAANRVHMRYVPYNGPGLAPSELPPCGNGRPRVCLTWGTTLARTFGNDFVGAQNLLIDALAALDIELVVAVDEYQGAMIGDTAPNVHVVVGAPLHMLMADCAAILHQGGAGSVLTAATYGLRQLSVSFLPDQAHVARVLADTGAGIHLPGSDSGPAEIQAAVRALLDEPGYGAAAAVLRSEMAAQPGPHRIVGDLAELTGAYGGIR
ncbi:nucleotide disphospho-sugar-binding domain-containing protein [Nocardia sp. NPDC020380]|uniref:nucleotide disphospho-sugar-binding domain-containing protein n=1 Tax=Nocardia sp. NPDC020380 TaxID=3364309 RepID=UPI00379D1ACB